MTKKKKHFIGLLILLLLLFVNTKVVLAEPVIREAPVDLNNLASDRIIIGLEGVDSTSAQEQMLKEINDVRKKACDEGDPDPRDSTGKTKLKSSDYVPLQIGVNCTKAAMIRAAEASICMGHGRPNGKEAGSALLYYSGGILYGSRAENLAWYPLSGSRMSGWIGERKDYLVDPLGVEGAQIGHYKNLINPNLRYMGVAVFNPVNDSASYNWGCTAGNYATNDTAISSLAGQQDQTVIQKIEIPVSAVQSASIAGAEAMKPGGSASLQLLTQLYFSSTAGANTITDCPVYNGLAWSSSDENVITIDQNGKATAKAYGTSTITATIGKGDAKKEYSRVIYVLGDDVTVTAAVDPETITVESYKKPILPGTVMVRLSNDMLMEADVVWDAYSESLVQTTFKSRDFYVTGKAAGMDVTQKVHVKAATMTGAYTDPARVTTTAGTEPDYPLACVTMSNGMYYHDLKVDWDEESRGYYKNEKGGEFTIRGTVSYKFPTDTGYMSVPVEAKLVVKPKGSTETGGSGSEGGNGSSTGTDGKTDKGETTTVGESGGEGTGGTDQGTGKKESGQDYGSVEEEAQDILDDWEKWTLEDEDPEDGSEVASDSAVVTRKGIVYKVRGGKAMVLRPQKKNVKKVTIPIAIKDALGQKVPVIGIAPKAFKGCKKLQTVTIGKGVIVIGKEAFYNCRGLKKLSIKTVKLTEKTVEKKAFKKLGKKCKVSVPSKVAKVYRKFLR